jgi:predicted peptidase
VRNTWLLAVALLIASPAAAQTGFLDQAVTLHGTTYRYQVYVPSDYAPTKVWALIVSLHGNGRQGSDGLLQTGTDFAIRVRENRVPFPALVIFPQAQVGTRWADTEMEELVIAELDQTMARFRVDAARVYLHGYSMGGSGGYRIAYKWPSRFAAIVIVAGRVIPAAPNTPVEIDRDRRANPFLTTADPFATLAERIKSLPIWVFHGDADERVPVGESRQLVAALKKVGATVRYTEYPGVDHNVAPQKASTDSELLGWLLAQHR